jgi:hypothetical protein
VRNGWLVQNNSGVDFVLRPSRNPWGRPEAEQLIRCIGDRTAWLSEERSLQKEPPPEALLQKRALRYGTLAILCLATVIGLYYLAELSFELYVLSTFGGDVLIICFFLFLVLSTKASYQLTIRKKRHLWDPQVTPPPDQLIIPDHDVYRKAQGRRLPEIELEHDQVYVYRSASNPKRTVEGEILYTWILAFILPAATLPLLFQLISIDFDSSPGPLLAAIWLSALVGVQHARGLRKWRGVESSRIRLEADFIVVEQGGETCRYQNRLIDKERRFLMPRHRFGQWEEFGKLGHSIRVDRRYLRPLHESEDLMPQSAPAVDNAEEDEELNA